MPGIKSSPLSLSVPPLLQCSQRGVGGVGGEGGAVIAQAFQHSAQLQPGSR